MKIHEYQARQLLQSYGIPFSRAEAVFEAEAAAKAFERLGSPSGMLKVQVLMGGRGKAGGVRRITGVDQARQIAASFLGKPFSTEQSGGQAKIVKAVLIAQDIPIEEEYYLGVVIDRAQNKPVILFSKAGGVDIEEVAAGDPSAIQKIHFAPDAPPNSQAVFQAIHKRFTNPCIAEQISNIAEGLSRFFVEKDVSISEINPLVLTAGDQVLALDAKVVFDDNAFFRHPELAALKDPQEEDERETRAKNIGLSYVSMDGNVGCLVNGAGLAMATMDMVQLAGGRPANFLDVGGGASAEQVREGFKIILEDERVRAILVNIFGGIMKCDVIAEGVIQASREVRLRAPLVVRLEGTHVEEGRALLKNSGFSIHTCRTIQEAAETAVLEAGKSNVHSSR